MRLTFEDEYVVRYPLTGPLLRGDQGRRVFMAEQTHGWHTSVELLRGDEVLATMDGPRARRRRSSRNAFDDTEDAPPARATTRFPRGEREVTVELASTGPDAEEASAYRTFLPWDDRPLPPPVDTTVPED